MRKMDQFLISMRLRANAAINNFFSSEQGSTDFISMLLIIGIIVVLAGAFLVLGKDVMKFVEEKVKGFLNSLG